MNVYFSPHALLLYTGLVLFLPSLFFHFRQQNRLALLFLMASGFFVFLSAIFMYPALFPWDERFHALVARNMMRHPFMPTLYDDPVVPMAYDSWDRFHVWLHKQPLFMWQSALSMKIFGVNEVAFRLPGAVVSTAAIYAFYRSGRLLHSVRAGYLAALLFVTSFYWKELLSGWRQLDQNDVSFIACISLSCWSWLEYLHSGKKRWLVLTGLFSGCAVLCKWLAGLLVYCLWFIYALVAYRLQWKKYLPLTASFAVSVLVFMPWQWYIFYRYPGEAAREYAFNFLHLTEVVEGHDGNYSYHLAMLGEIAGNLFPYLFLPMALVFAWRLRDKKLAVAIVSGIVLTELFFMQVPTKMPSFTAILLWLFFMVAAVAVDEMFTLVFKNMHRPKLKNALWAAGLLLLVFYRTDLNGLEKTHHFFSGPDTFTRLQLNNRDFFRQLRLPPRSVLFNVPGRHYVEAMFYTGQPAYNFIPSEQQYQTIRQKGRRAVVLKNPGDTLPQWLTADPSVLVLPNGLVRCE